MGGKDKKELEIATHKNNFSATVFIFFWRSVEFCGFINNLPLFNGSLSGKLSEILLLLP